MWIVLMQNILISTFKINLVHNFWTFAHVTVNLVYMNWTTHFIFDLIYEWGKWLQYSWYNTSDKAQRDETFEKTENFKSPILNGVMEQINWSFVKIENLLIQIVVKAQKFTGTRCCSIWENLFLAIIVLSIINNKQSQWDERHYFFVHWIQKICSL